MKQILITILCFSSIYLTAQIPNSISKADKVYGLSKLWQEVNYNFVYLYKIDKAKWENDYKTLIEEVQKTKNDYEYYRLLQRFCATLKDGHTIVYFPDTIQNNLQNTYFGEYRLFITNIENKAIVTRTNLSKKDEIPIGTEVIKVNGIDTKSYLEQEVIPYISSSTDYILMDRAISRIFESSKGTSFDITFKLPNGKIKELKLTHEETTEKEIYPEFEDWQLFEFKWINDDIAYVLLNSFSDPQINTLFLEKLPELYKAKKLIIDLRKNTGGNSKVGRDIFQYLTNDTLLFGSKTQSRLHISTYKAWGSFLEAKDTLAGKPEWGMSKEEALKCFLIAEGTYPYDFNYEPDTIEITDKKIVVPTVLLIGHDTASAAEDFLISADNQKHIIKIGERTNGSTGQPMTFELPGGGSAWVCTKKDTYPDGKEFVGYGILPDIEVKKSFEDYMENKDPVLQRAIQYLEKN